MAGFEPKISNKQQITVRIEENLIKRIDKLATELNISRSELLGQCIEYALADMKK